MTAENNPTDAVQNADNGNADQAPAAELPDVAPDFVSDTLETINDSATGADPAEVTAAASEVAAEVASVLPL